MTHDRRIQTPKVKTKDAQVAHLEKRLVKARESYERALATNDKTKIWKALSHVNFIEAEIKSWSLV
jgi:hypothetical protein